MFVSFFLLKTRFIACIDHALDFWKLLPVYLSIGASILIATLDLLFDTLSKLVEHDSSLKGEDLL